MTDGRPRNSGQEVPYSAAFRRQVANAVRAAEFEAREFAGVPVFHDQPSLLEAGIRTVDPALDCWVEQRELHAGERAVRDLRSAP
ncbi:hypothetical protein ABT061_11755 [Streptosporangium sp. NPDC002544]|uniref:hypothetical protein n=1 Tax=Streptosporangium sp. NPDC002544 TaxID=3154538 RepID=UPI00332359A4